jgi:hypothetical protein
MNAEFAATSKLSDVELLTPDILTEHPPLLLIDYEIGLSKLGFL